MIWKKRESNLIIVSMLSVAYTAGMLLVMIGPLHMDSTGGIFPLSALAIYIVLLWAVAMIVSWGLYFAFKKDPEPLFFTLLAFGVAFILSEIYLWGLVGS